MDFFEINNYSTIDIENLIKNEVEENIHLDYKAAGALDKKDDKKRIEITKDVSAFANSDGGIIIYGISEIDHRPNNVSFIDGRVYTTTQKAMAQLFGIDKSGISRHIANILKEGELKQEMTVAKIATVI